jgi:hypothetical protein
LSETRAQISVATYVDGFCPQLWGSDISTYYLANFLAIDSHKPNRKKFSCTTVEMMDRQRDGGNEVQQAFLDTGEVCLKMDAETCNSPPLVQPLLEEMK